MFRNNFLAFPLFIAVFLVLAGLQTVFAAGLFTSPSSTPIPTHANLPSTSSSLKLTPLPNANPVQTTPAENEEDEDEGAPPPGTSPSGQIVIHVATPSGAIPSLGNLISAGISAAIVISGLLAFFYLVWGGIEWLTSGGDKAKYDAARGRITAAIVGLAIVAASWAIMQLVAQFFGLNLTNLVFPSAA